MPNLDIDSWISTLSDLPKIGTSKDLFDYDIRFGEGNIKVEQLIAGGIAFANTQIGVTRNLDSWTGLFSNERLIGQLELWDKESKPMAIHLKQCIFRLVPYLKIIYEHNQQIGRQYTKENVQSCDFLGNKFFPLHFISLKVKV